MNQILKYLLNLFSTNHSRKKQIGSLSHLSCLLNGVETVEDMQEFVRICSVTLGFSFEEHLLTEEVHNS
jgi:hypothetical protein